MPAGRTFSHRMEKASRAEPGRARVFTVAPRGVWWDLVRALKSKMTWDITPPRKRFYRRAWFLVPLALMFLIAAGGGVYGLLEMRKWDKMAEQFDFSKLAQMESASTIYDRDGQVIGRILIQNRDEVSIDELSPQLLKAVVGGEDARFYQHDGVDYYGIARAFVKNYQAGRTRQGASTLTQQLARNTFSDDLKSNDRSYARKMLEIAVARQVEKRLTKQQILSLYLNRVFFGSGFYGAEAASRGYFGKHARDLDLSESATLVGLLKSPNNLSPWRNRQACIDQRNYVLQRMLELKMIGQAEYDATRQQDLIVKNRRPIHQESYAAEMVAQQVKKLVGDESAVSEGYRIYTTIDADLQRKAESTLRDHLAAAERHEGFEHQTYAQYDQLFRAYRRKYASEGESAGPQPEAEYLQGTVVMMDNATGGLLALVGGRDFSQSPFNRALFSHRPVGTAFTPMVYAAAFENGQFPGTAVQDAVMDNRQVMIGGQTGILGEWGPERVDNKYEGLISARTALVKSKNAATIRLGMKIGKNLGDSLEKLSAVTSKAGIDTAVRQFPAAFLGASEMTPMEMTLAMTVFPEGGSRPAKPFIIQRIEEKSGRVIFEEKPEREKAISPASAYEVHSCLAEVLDRGTAEKTFTSLGLKRYDLGGKTGTAYNFTDVWFLGYSSQVTCSVWAGFDKPRTTIYRGAFSNEIALPIWASLMKETFARYKPKEILPPKGLIKLELCASSGLLATDKCFETTENKETGEKVQHRTTYVEIATDAQAPKDACDVHGDVPRSYVKAEPATRSQWPRAGAVPTAIPENMTPVVIKSLTVLGNDPYNSVQSVSDVAARGALAGKTAPLDNTLPPAGATADPGTPEIKVMRAVAARPMEQSTQIETNIKWSRPHRCSFSGRGRFCLGAVQRLFSVRG